MSARVFPHAAVVSPHYLASAVGLGVLSSGGNAAGTVSARIGAPYAGPGNGFWRTLHEVGLTPSLLAEILHDLHLQIRDREVGLASPPASGVVCGEHLVEVLSFQRLARL